MLVKKMNIIPPMSLSFQKIVKKFRVRRETKILAMLLPKVKWQSAEFVVYLREGDRVSVSECAWVERCDEIRYLHYSRDVLRLEDHVEYTLQIEAQEAAVLAEKTFGILANQDIASRHRHQLFSGAVVAWSVDAKSFPRWFCGDDEALVKVTAAIRNLLNDQIKDKTENGVGKRGQPMNLDK